MTATNDAVGGTNRSGIDGVLQMDDEVAQLTDEQVKDAWVRGKFAHECFRARLPAHEQDRCEGLLQDGTNAALKQVAIIVAGRQSSLAQCLGWEEGPGNRETLWNRWTKDDIPEDRTVTIARKKLRTALHGCGMPRINTIRARVSYFSEHPDETE